MTKTIVIDGKSGDGSTTEFRDAIDLMCEAVYQNASRMDSTMILPGLLNEWH
jgi:hypothetical protein